MTTVASRARKIFSLGLTPEKGNEILGVLIAALVVLLAASLFSFYPHDPSVLHQPAGDGEAIRNWIGPFGAQISAMLFAIFGLTALLLPVLLGTVAWKRLTSSESATKKERIFGIVAVFVSLPGLTQLVLESVVWRGIALDSGGVVGLLLSRFLVTKLNFGGAFLVLFTTLLVGSSLAAHTTLSELLVALRRHLETLWEHLMVLRVRRHKRREDEKTRRRVMERFVRDKAAERESSHGETVKGKAKRSTKRSRSAEDSDIAVPAPAAPEVELPNRVVPKKGEGHFAIRKVHPPAPPAPPAAKRAPRQETIDFGDDELRPQELPPVNLLTTEPSKKAHDEAELMRRGERITQCCKDFGVDGKVVGVSPGPVITVYEFQPAPGVKVSRIVGLQDDLALALKAESVRIDRIPGHSRMGIEVPNEKRSLIHLGHLLDKLPFRQAPSKLSMALGVDLNGKPYYADLATMPHLLVAGATGAGKSVGLQSMITSVLYKATREEVQFIFIDPKRIELGVYADIPHLKTEVVVDPKKAANALRWSVAEMERRYRLLAEVHVRSIDYYNRAIRDPKERERLALRDSDGQSEFRPEDFKPLPYYVIIIDELADLMMVASGDVETSIARLAQMARAVGIHLIVATQRPSVDVLTGTIKANFPCRLAFATATRHDSRTILDQVGAEKLLGKGDALFMPPGTSRIMRLHGAYVSEKETASLIRWLKRHGKPDIDPDVVKDQEESGGASGGAAGAAEDDPLFDEAARLVVTERQASASYLQRRMRIGFSRAARLVDMLEADGILGPAQGAKSRDVLVPPDYFEEIDTAKAQE